MGGGASRIQLHGDAGVEDFPASTEVGERFGKRRRRLLAVHGGEIALWTIDRLIAGGEPVMGEARRHHPVSSGHACVQRLHHRADVLLEAAGR